MNARHFKPDGRFWNYVKWYFGRGRDPYSYRPRETYKPRGDKS